MISTETRWKFTGILTNGFRLVDPTEFVENPTESYRILSESGKTRRNPDRSPLVRIDWPGFMDFPIFFLLFFVLVLFSGSSFFIVLPCFPFLVLTYLLFVQAQKIWIVKMDIRDDYEIEWMYVMIIRKLGISDIHFVTSYI
jgi:hypothetical protein